MANSNQHQNWTQNRKVTINKNDQNIVVDFEGKIEPHSDSLEETVLGQLLIASDALSDVMNILTTPDIFYHPSNKLIFKAMEDLNKENNPINLETIAEKLMSQENLENAGGLARIADLTMKVSSAANIEHHAKLLVQKYIQRQLIQASAKICEKAFDPACEISELTDFAEKEVMTITDQNIQRRTFQDIKTVATDVFQHINDIIGKDIKLAGLGSGYIELDRITSGWQKGNMVVIAARPGMGKTAFVISMIRQMAIEQKIPMAMFSLEMSCEQLATRLFVGEAKIKQDALRTGNVTDEELGRLSTAMEKLSEAPLWLDDTPALGIFEFKSKCRKLREKHHVECIIVDYLQLMTATGSFSREQEVGTISRGIKEIAMELQIPIIALAQLNRGLENRANNDKKPRLADLRESGSIEQDADMVLFIHRPSQATGSKQDENGNNIEKQAFIIVAKNRHGAQGEAELIFEGDYMSFNAVPKDFTQPEPQQESQPSQVIPSAINFDKDNRDDHKDPFGDAPKPDETF